MTRNGLPDLPDIQAAGMGLTEALAWWSNMKNKPGHPAAYWWQRLREYQSAKDASAAHPTVQ
jgi:hypothetical protein